MTLAEINKRLASSNFEGIDCKEYRGYGIEKAHLIDSDGKRIKNSTFYLIYEDEDYVGESYLTLADAKKEIDKWENK